MFLQGRLRALVNLSVRALARTRGQSPASKEEALFRHTVKYWDPKKVFLFRKKQKTKYHTKGKISSSFVFNHPKTFLI